jgi:phosphate transport system protein
MWRRAADAWVERDASAHADLDSADDQLDMLQERLVSELESADISLPDALQTTLLARFYERLGDHAVHISERIQYLARGSST